MAYLALLVYTAMMFVRPQEWVPWMLGWPIEAILVVVALVTWAGSVASGGWRLGRVPQDWLMLGLFFAVLMSHVSHFYLDGLKASFCDFGKTVLLYFLTVSLLGTRRRTRAFLVVLIAGCLFLATHAMLQVWTGEGFGGQAPLTQMEDEGIGAVRAKAFGIFDDPNDLALTLVAILPFVLSTVFRKNGFAPARLLAAAAAAAMVCGIYLTNSRGGWLGLGAMGLAFIFTRFSRKAGIALAAIAFVAFIGLGPSRLGVMSSAEESVRGRLMAWADGNRMLKSAPLFGVGKGMYTDFSESGLVAHNSFVHCYAELGLFGYFFWLGMVCACLKDAYALSKLKPESPEAAECGEWGKASLASLAGFLAAGFFLSKTYLTLAFILFGLIAAVRQMAQREGEPLEGCFRLTDGKYVALAEVLSIPAIYVFMRVITAGG